jgi:hypothetical protein
MNSSKPDAPATPSESLQEFLHSVSYGSRTDLNFKWLSFIPQDEATAFIQKLFVLTADAIDSADVSLVDAHIRQAQIRAYSQNEPSYRYDDCPVTLLNKPLIETRLMLLTSSGHFVRGNDPGPLGMTNATQADVVARIDDFLREPPQLSAIPVHTSAENLHVRHPGYDIRPAQADANVNFPLELLRDMAEAGKLNLHTTAYSFVGACIQTPLRKRLAPAWAQQFREEGVETALLVPV